MEAEITRSSFADKRKITQRGKICFCARGTGKAKKIRGEEPTCGSFRIQVTGKASVFRVCCV